MKTINLLIALALFSLALFPTYSRSEDGNVELQKRLDFINAYNGKRADKRLAAISILANCKEERSIETLYFVSWADGDPEVRSLAFTTFVKSDDLYGFVAYLAAESFRRENEIGAKVEKAVAMGNLKYKYSPLNELVKFMSTLRWSVWNWPYAGYHRSGAYISQGTPPAEVPDYPEDKKDFSLSDGKGKEPLRWQSENELIGLIATTINKLAGTRMESRARVDQEIVKWWERKGELWEEFDRKQRAKALANQRAAKFKTFEDMHFEEIKPGTDTIRPLQAQNTIRPATPAKVKDNKPLDEKALKAMMDED